jgi:bifunctional DNA-binding transcriptional regulator/antitoxin component of YhaV-PrlF toxin-antitoxin module
VEGEFRVKPARRGRGIKIGAPLSILTRAGQQIIVVVGIHDNRRAVLFEVGDALQGTGLEFGGGQGRQKQRRQDRDDGNNHQKLDQRESR